MENEELVHNERVHAFELMIEGKRSFIDYQKSGDKIYLTHTEVPQEQQGRGIADKLVRKTLEYIEKNDLKVVPQCQFVRVFLKRHPEWDRLVASYD